MRRITIILSVVIALFALALPARAATKSMFKKLTAYSSTGGFSIVLEFDGEPEEKLRFSADHIGIDFQNAVIAGSKKLYEIDRAGIKTIEISQAAPDIVAVRITPSGEMKALVGSLSLQKQNGRLELKFADSSSTTKAAPTAQTKSVSAAKPPVKPVKVKTDNAPQPKAAEQRNPVKNEEGDRISYPPPTGSPVTAGVTAGMAAADELAASLRAATSTVAAVDADNGKPLLLDYSDPEVPELPSFGESLAKVGGGLAVVLAMVIFVAFAAKKYLSGMKSGIGTKKQLRVLSNHYIGVKKSVTIVELAGELLVLGVTNDNINLLARYDDPEKIERIMFTHRLPNRPLGFFKRLPLFSRAARKGDRKKSAFAKEVDRSAAAMNEKKKESAVKRKSAKEELISQALGSIAGRFSPLENGAG